MPGATRTARPVRSLSASELGIGQEYAVLQHASNRPDESGRLPDDDPLLLEVRRLLKFYGGVIFTGPPGTSKSYLAAQIGTKLVEGDQGRIRFVQFHPSYQYEDFMQGFVPRATGDGFTMEDKHFVDMCRVAERPENEHKLYVLVIDELSRGDAGRVFGEALTYVERSKRGMQFQLASGQLFAVPPNFVILATMNPLDRGVDEVDAAFERRFAKIAMDPDGVLLGDRLDANGVPEYLRERILRFFHKANRYADTNPQGAIGHTFFFDVTDTDSLQMVWDHQLRFLVEKAYRLDPDTRDDLQGEFERLFEPPLEE